MSATSNTLGSGERYGNEEGKNQKTTNGKKKVQDMVRGNNRRFGGGRKGTKGYGHIYKGFN